MVPLDTRDTFKIPLKDGSEARLIYEHYTGRELRRFCVLGSDEHRQTLFRQSPVQIMDILLAAIRDKLVGWEDLVDNDGAAVPFDPARLEDFLTVPQMWDIYYRVQLQCTLKTTDKKKLESPSPTLSEAPAPESAIDATGETTQSGSAQSSNAPPAAALDATSAKNAGKSG